MSDKVFIERYRGIDIEFDRYYEKFSCIITEEATKESHSYKAVKGFIDEYKKHNQNFKPFLVEGIPGTFQFEKRDRFKIIGVRKDNRFIYLDAKGKKKQLSDYHEKSYMLAVSQNEEALKRLRKLEKLRERQNRIIDRKRAEIIKTLEIVTLEQVKDKLIKDN